MRLTVPAAEGHEDPVVAAFRDGPIDDEPVTEADERALAEVRTHRAAGGVRISCAEVMRKYGPL